MGIGDFLKNVFKKEGAPPEQVEEIITDKRYCNEVCELCGEVIKFERYKKVGGKYTHKSCFKKRAKQILNGELNIT